MKFQHQSRTNLKVNVKGAQLLNSTSKVEKNVIEYKKGGQILSFNIKGGQILSFNIKGGQILSFNRTC